jgi:molybdate transport system substrate-binding protein
MAKTILSSAHAVMVIAGALVMSAGSMIPMAAHAQTVLVFAAASLKNALDDVDTAHRKQGGARAVVSYLASSTLARQIENGAPADVFFSADLEWMAYLDKRGLIRPQSRTNLLRNELVLVAPAQSKLSIAVEAGFPLGDQLAGGRLAIADPDHVPAGKYAKSALEALGVWPSVARRLARAENVRAALLFVSRGEAPLGVVYRTDAAADKQVRIAGVFPAGSHPPIVYPVALLAGSRSRGAQAYFDFVRSPAAMTIFRRHGFLPY